MANTPDDKSLRDSESSAYAEDANAETSEDLSLEDEREALKEARDGQARDGAGEGQEFPGHGNLHFGDQQESEWNNPADARQGADGELPPAGADGTAAQGDDRNDAVGAESSGAGGEEVARKTAGDNSGGDDASRGAPQTPATQEGSAADRDDAEQAGAPKARPAGDAAEVVAQEASVNGGETETARDDRAPVNEAPTDIDLSNDTVAENEPGATIATLTATDPDANDTATFSLVEDASGLFEVVGDQLRLKEGVSLDHEAQDSYEIVIEVKDGAGNVYSETVTVHVSDLNEGPTDIALSNTGVDENNAGAVIATLSSSDPDAGDTARYSIADDPSGLFEVDGDTLKLKDGVALDHEAQESYEITLEVEDSSGATHTETFTINVADLNEGPTGLALTGDKINENQSGATVGTLSAFDPDAGDTLTFTVSDDRFEVIGDQLKLKDGVSLDHEAAESIDVTVTATDAGGLSSEQTFTINIADVNERPTDIDLSNNTIDENDAGAVVGTLSAADPDVGDTHTFTVSDDRFEVVGDQLKLKDGVSFDHETTDALDVTVTATDAGGLSSEQTFTINVADVNESPTDIALSNNTIDENDAGAVVGTLSADDPDVGDTHTFTVSDDRFEVVGGQLKLKDGVSLDHETVDAVDVTVTATDSGGLETSQSFTINIADVNEAPTDIVLSPGGAVGEEFIVNTTTASHQLQPSIAALENGGFVSTWSSLGQDGSGYGVFAQTFDANGEPVGGEVQVNTTSFGSQLYSSVTALDGGGYVVVWNGPESAGSTTRIHGQVFDENGAPVGGEFEVSSADTLIQTLPDVSALDGGGFVVTWSDYQSGGGYYDVYTRQFEADGTATGDQTLVHDGAAGYQYYSAVEGLADGGYIVAWSDYDFSTGQMDIHAQRFDADGNEIGDTTTVGSGDPRFEYSSDIAALPDGGYVVTWSAYAQDENGIYNYDIRAQQFDADGAPVGDEFQVNGVTQGAQINSTVSATPDGGYMITWSDSFGTGYDIKAQIFDSDANPVGDEFTVNTELASTQSTPDLAMLADGSIAVVWQTFSLDGSGYNIAANVVSRGDVVLENTAGGTVVAHLTAVDPDANESFTYSVVGDSPFEVVGDLLVVKEGAVLDHETAPEHDVTLQVDDSAGNIYTETVTISIADVNEGPSDIQLLNTTINENDAGAVVGTVSAFDPDAGDTLTFTVSDDRFEIVGNALKVKDGVAFDHEATESIDITVTATDTGGLSTEQTFTINIADVNEAPTDIALSNNTIDENDAGAVVGTLSAADPDVGDTATFTLADDPSGLFEIVGDQLKLKDGVSLDYETQDAYDVTVQVTDSGGADYSETVTINVADLAEAPTGFALQPVAAPDALSLNQDGGNDDVAIAADMQGFPTQALTVEVAFTSSQTDVGNGVPLFSYAADGGSNNEALIWLPSGSGNVHIYLAGAAVNTGIPNASLLDGEPHQFSFTWDQASNELKVYVDGDEEFASSINIRDLRADGTLAFGQEQDSEGGGFDVNQIFEGEISEARIFDYARSAQEIADYAGEPLSGPGAQTGLVSLWLMNGENGGVVEDVIGNNHLQLYNDAHITEGAPYDEPTVLENDGGALVGTLSATDADTGGPVTDFAIADDASGLFEIVGDQLKLKDGVSLDHETQDSYELTLEATGAAGETTQMTVTVNVANVDEAPIDLAFDPAFKNSVLSLNEDGGTDDYAIATDLSSFPTDALTVEVAFASAQSDLGNGVPLFSYAASGGSDNEALIWLETGSGNLHIFLAGRKINTGVSNSSLLDGEQHQVSFSWDQSTNELKVYVDGALEFETSVSVRDLKADGALVFGQEQDAEGGGFSSVQVFEGEIIEARIFDYARSDAEIADNAGAPLADPQSEPGLVNNWVMNDETGGVIQDLAGGDNLQLQGGAAVVESEYGGPPTVAENLPGAVVGVISATDPVTGGPVTDFVLSDDPSGLFELVGDQLKLKDNAYVDYETQNAYDVTITAIGSGGENTPYTLTVNVADMDEINVILGTEGNDRLRGTSGEDAVYGFGGNDNINAGAGADEIYAGAGNDVIFATAEDTVIDGGEGTDRVIVQGTDGLSIDMTAASVERVDGGVGNDFMNALGMTDRVFQYGRGGDDTLIGGEGNDIQRGDAGADNITGGGGNDAIRGGAGNDVIDGGDGNDNIRGDAGADQLSGGAGNDLIYADADDTLVEGGAGNDRVIVQGNGDFSIDMTAMSVERVYSASGNDVLNALGMTDRVFQYGRGGDDTLMGGEGNDIQRGDAGADIISGGGGNDAIRGGTGNDVIAGGDGNDNIRGDAGADQLSGGAGNDLIYADVNDTLVHGGAGYDRVIVQGNGDFSIDMTAMSVERVDGGGGDDQMDASGMTAAVRQYGRGGADTMTGGAGNDVQQGGGGADLISGGAGRDNIRGGGGNDVIDGGSGRDSIRGDAGDDLIRGGDDNDNIRGGSGNDQIYGDAGNDRLYGQNGNDTLYGGDGADRLYGGAGDDVIDGGDGADRLYGQSGSDVFVYETGDGADRIYGGAGGGWTDAIQLSEGDTPLGEFGVDWTINLTQGSIVSADENKIVFSDDADGVITFSDNTTLTFSDIEEVII